jgi:Histidine kinase-, DNA gyrase B-, and HSP90-like ATPase
MELRIGLDSINSYRRLSYSAWHALAEFIDNSTQSYFNNKTQLDELFKKTNEILKVDIVYSAKDAGLIRISDNSTGMSYTDLQNALHVGKVPVVNSGRSKYGMGLKTAACWLGNVWTIRTKKFGETDEHFITIDVSKVSGGDNQLGYSKIEGKATDDHYTIIEITNLNKKFQGRTLGKIRDFLSSMYRMDFRNKQLTLTWQGDSLKWIEPEFLANIEGRVYKKDFSFISDNKTITGWVGILKNGSRADAGFSIIQSGRVIKGWPLSWRPHLLYGQLEGSNDLVNQRLVGEINLDGFEVSHTKDDILWFGDQEEDVEKLLLEHCSDFKEIAKTYRKSDDDARGPSEAETAVAIDELKRELFSSEMVDKISITVVPTEEAVKQSIHIITESVTGRSEPAIEGIIGGITFKLYIDAEMSPNDPYLSVEISNTANVIIIVNSAHPHWGQLKGSDGVLNYLKHCTYDGVAEWMASSKASRLDPNTIKLLKDNLLRVSFDIEGHTI